MKNASFDRREFLKGTGWMLGAALAGGCAVGRRPGEAPAAPADAVPPGSSDNQLHNDA